MGKQALLAERWPLDATTRVEVAIEAAAGGGPEGGRRYRLALVQNEVPVLVFTGSPGEGHRFCLRDRCLPYTPYSLRRLLDDFWDLVHQLTRGGAPCAG